MTDWDWRNLCGRKKFLPVELCEEAISRVERLNPILNAGGNSDVRYRRDAARKPLSEGPFAGVPFLLKDLISAYAGV